MSYRVLISRCAFVLIVIFVSAMGLCQSSDDEEFIRKHQFDVVKVGCERIDDYAISRVFHVAIYHLTMSVKEGYGPGPYWGNVIAARVGDTLAPIPQPRDAENPDLLAMLNSDFRLNNGDAAETFQRALDLVFPTTTDRAWMEKFEHDGNEWRFLRGRSVSTSRAGEFVVTTDQQGKITDVRNVSTTIESPVTHPRREQ